jgi:hypothetical protein
MTQLAIVTKEPSVNIEVNTIATAAVLIDLRISTWTGRKRDKKTSDDVIAAHQATSDRAASVIKNLMSDDKDLDGIRAYAQDTRLYLHRNTYAWNDSGTRMLPSSMIFEVTSELDARITAHEVRVARFIDGYGVKVNAAAFKLGQLFDRNEYPSADEVHRKFSMGYTMSPVPTSGDFRVDVQKDVGEFLKRQYETAANARLAEMLREPWQRIYDSLTHVRDRMEAALAYEPDAGIKDGRKAPKLFQSLLDNALDLANLLDKLNVTNDPALSEVTAKMRRTFSTVDIKSLRESKDQQASVKTQVESILSSYDFSGFGDE